MSKTIQWYILRDLLKVFGITTMALAMILTLGSLVRPIQRFGVGPSQAVRLVAYMMPVTVTLVLPVAALFAAALTYGRFATDNEYDACRASGISPMEITYPGLLLACITGICTLLMALHIMPYFVQMAERAINADLRRIVFRHLERFGYYRFGPSGAYTIYADHADPKTGTLYGVVILQEGQDRIEQVLGADLAQVFFERAGQLNKIRIVSSRPFQWDLTAGTQLQASAISAAAIMEPLLTDKIVFKDVGQINQIRANPLLYRPIQAQATDLWLQAIVEILGGQIQQASQSGLAYRLTGPGLGCELKAGQATVGKGRIEIAGPVELAIRPYQGPDTSTRWLARWARLSIRYDGQAPVLVLELDDARAVDGTGPITGPQLPPLEVPGPTLQIIGPPSSLAGITSSKTKPGLSNPSPYFLDQLQTLDRSLRLLYAQIRAELHTRLAIGIACVPLVIIGIGLGIIKRGGHLLSAFAISCIPALVLVAAIVGGKGLAREPGGHNWLGLAIIWAGVAGMVAVAGWVYARLPR
ncbi:MAG: LptF/LptG family permease [Sedimentisphaerales bacterium]|jgi:lipopolysaccharide export LptBFGC system permease protein LptF|nr:LptF/LptG family permease [Sedimentisphaerales bacterium]